MSESRELDLDPTGENVRRDLRRLLERAVRSREEALMWEMFGLRGAWERPMPRIALRKR